MSQIFASPCYAIKIGLQTGTDSTGIGTSVKGIIIDANTNHSICDLEAMKGYEIKPYHNLMAIQYKGKFYKVNSDNIVIKPVGTGFVSAKGRWYRGIIMIQNKNGKLTVINNIPLEDYIKGVVPSEMPSSWATEAHKAQAIAARSYALANLGKRARYGYDLKDTPEDQAYRGASAETADTNYAVDQTKGIVLTYNMKVISAYYSASAGGMTNTNSWGSNLPYLRSVPSFDDNIKKTVMVSACHNTELTIWQNKAITHIKFCNIFTKMLNLPKLTQNHITNLKMAILLNLQQYKPLKVAL